MDYEVMLTRDARRLMRELSREEKEFLVQGLRTELTDQPGPDTVIIRRSGSHRLPPGTYLAHALPGYVVIYRRMTPIELARLAAEQGRHVSSTGFAVFDFVPAVTPG